MMDRFGCYSTIDAHWTHVRATHKIHIRIRHFHCVSHCCCFVALFLSILSFLLWRFFSLTLIDVLDKFTNCERLYKWKYIYVRGALLTKMHAVCKSRIKSIRHRHKRLPHTKHTYWNSRAFWVISLTIMRKIIDTSVYT